MAAGRGWRRTRRRHGTMVVVLLAALLAQVAGGPTGAGAEGDACDCSALQAALDATDAELDAALAELNQDVAHREGLQQELADRQQFQLDTEAQRDQAAADLQAWHDRFNEEFDDPLFELVDILKGEVTEDIIEAAVRLADLNTALDIAGDLRNLKVVMRRIGLLGTALDLGHLTALSIDAIQIAWQTGQLEGALEEYRYNADVRIDQLVNEDIPAAEAAEAAALEAYNTALAAYNDAFAALSQCQSDAQQNPACDPDCDQDPVPPECEPDCDDQDPVPPECEPSDCESDPFRPGCNDDDGDACPEGARCGDTWGDPFLTTFDGVAYTFQAEGEFVLVESDVDDFAVHVEYGGHSRIPTVAWVHAVAVRFGGDVVTYLDAGDPLVNGEVVGPGPHTLEGGMVVDGGQVDLPDGTRVRASVPEYFVTVALAPDRHGRVGGLLGDADGDEAAEVQVPPEFDELYEVWGPAQQTSDSDRFLPGPRRTYSSPAGQIGLEDLDPADLAAARDLCLAAGWPLTDAIATCVHDVAVSGDASFASASPPLGAVATTTTTDTPTIAALAALGVHLPHEVFDYAVDDLVGPGTPSPGAGVLETPQSTDTYRLTATAGQALRLIPVALDSGSVAASVRLVDPTGAVLVDAPLGPDPVDLTVEATGGHRLIVRSTAGDHGEYGFTVHDTGGEAHQEFTYVVGELIEPGSPGPGAGIIETPLSSDTYTFTGAVGDEIALEVLDDGPGVSTTLRRPDGSEVFADQTGGWVEDLDQNGTYQLRVGAWGAGEYRMRLVVPQHDTFDIEVGDTVSDGVPGPGAGNIETIFGSDTYRFTAAIGQQVHVTSSVPDGLWQATVTFANGQVVGGPLQTTTIPIPATGLHEVRIDGVAGGLGTYDFESSFDPPAESAAGAEALPPLGAVASTPLLPPGVTSWAAAVNAVGTVVGFTADGGGSTVEAFVRGRGDAVATPLGTLGGSSSVATDINARGVVVGSSLDADGVGRAFVVDPADGVMTDLGTLGGDRSEGTAINDAGIVIGASDTGGAESEVHAFLAVPGEDLTDLGTLGGRFSTATDINADGVVVGLSETADGDLRPFVYDPDAGQIEDLVGVAGWFARPEAVSDTGVVVGARIVDEDDADVEPFAYDLVAGELLELPTSLGKGVVPHGVSSPGIVVGHRAVGDGPDEAIEGFAADVETGEVTNLETRPGLSLHAAVNEAGVVVGVAAPGSAVTGRAFLYDRCGRLTDVAAWAESAICWLVNAEHASGFADRTFRPAGKVTRAQVASMLYRIEGASGDPGGDCGRLRDVPAWARDAICWLVEEGHASGFADRTFRPAGKVTRAQVASMLFRINTPPG